MSRYKLELDDERIEAIVGWDAGLASYFAQVKPVGEVDSYDLILWAGTSVGEIPNVEQLQNVIREYVSIPDEILKQLECDREAEPIGSLLIDKIHRKAKPEH